MNEVINRKFNIEKYFNTFLKDNLEKRIYNNKKFINLHKKLILTNYKTLQDLPNKDKKTNFNTSLNVGLINLNSLNEYFKLSLKYKNKRKFLLNFLKKECLWNETNDVSSFFDKNLQTDKKDLSYLVLQNNKWLILISLFKTRESKTSENFEKLLGYYYKINDNNYEKEIINYTENLIKHKQKFYFMKVYNLKNLLKIYENDFSESKKEYIIYLLSNLDYFLKNINELLYYFSFNFQENFLFILNKRKKEEFFFLKRCYWETTFIKTRNFCLKINEKDCFPNFVTFFNKKINLNLDKNKRKSCDFINNFYIKNNFHERKGSILNCYFIDNLQIDFFEIFKFKNLFFLNNFLKNCIKKSYVCKLNNNFPFFICLISETNKFTENFKKNNYNNYWNCLLLYNDNLDMYPHYVKICNKDKNNLFINKKNCYHNLTLIHNDQLNYFLELEEKNINSNFSSLKFHPLNLFHNRKLDDFSYLYDHCSSFIYGSNLNGPSTINLERENDKFIVKYFNFFYKDFFVNEENFLDIITEKLKNNNVNEKIKISKFIFNYFF